MSGSQSLCSCALPSARLSTSRGGTAVSLALSQSLHGRSPAGSYAGGPACLGPAGRCWSSGVTWAMNMPPGRWASLTVCLSVCLSVCQPVVFLHCLLCKYKLVCTPWAPCAIPASWVCRHVASVDNVWSNSRCQSHICLSSAACLIGTIIHNRNPQACCSCHRRCFRSCQHAYSKLQSFYSTASPSHLVRQCPSCIAALLQVEGEGELVQAQNQKLHRELWQRQREALLRSQPEAAEAAAAAKEAAMTHMPSMTDHPAWIQQGQLYPHQLQVCCC